MKKIMIYLLFSVMLLAYNDSDFDGVADEHDLCPNSEMTDIVDLTGCTIEKLINKENQPHHFDIIMGVNYIEESKSLNESLQTDYYYNDFALELRTAHYDKMGIGDTTTTLYYTLKTESKLSFRFGVSAILPTYDSFLNNNKIDYTTSLFMNYQIKSLSLFGGIGYTFMGDDDINNTSYKITYQNAPNYYLGFGSYFIPKLYSSFIYTFSDKSYKEGEALKNLSFYNYYIINNHWFTNFGYNFGLTDNASNQSYINLGYYF